MPFEPCGARSFTLSSLRNNAPPRPGVYGLSDSQSWLFVAETDNILAALTAHLQDGSAKWRSRKPRGFSFEACVGPERTRRLNELIREFRPLYHSLK